MQPEVTVRDVDERPTGVVCAQTTWQEFPRLWGKMLDQVHALLPKKVVGRNVMLYKDQVPNVEIGVLLLGDFEPAGNVVRSALPAGRVATTLCTEGYAALDRYYRALDDHCRAAGLEQAGPHWEIYGHVIEPNDPVDVEISFLLA